MTPETLPADTAIGRVALRAGDIDGLVEFYTSIVGLTVLSRREGGTTLGVDGRPLLELIHEPDAPLRGDAQAGLFHVAFRVPDRAALGAALSRIEDDWRLTGASDHRVSEALYLRDPEDNGVEIYRDRPREAWPTDDGRVQIDTLPLDLDALREDASDAATLPADADVGHVHLEVTDVDAAQSFYVDALDLSVRQAWNGAVFVAAGGYHHHVGLNVWNRRTEPASGRGLAWFELLVPEQAHAAVRERVAAAGVTTSDVSEGFAVADPDGIEVRVVARE